MVIAGIRDSIKGIECTVNAVIAVMLADHFTNAYVGLVSASLSLICQSK